MSEQDDGLIDVWITIFLAALGLKSGPRCLRP